MILAALAEVTDRPLVVTFSVPGGQAMATKTTNERLGILGGISILGTTGIVKPFSTASYRASVVQQVDVAAAQGHDLIVLATGSRSEDYVFAAWPDTAPGLRRRGRRLHRDRPAPRRRGRDAAGGLRRHGRQDHQAGGRA